MTPKEYSGAFRSWLWMMKRCLDPLDELYSRYGGAGKGVCDRWMRFDAFLADMGGRPEGFSLDRIENDTGYQPGNCRWADSTTQSQNRKSGRFYIVNGERVNQSVLARRLGLHESTVYRRYAKNPKLEQDWERAE